MPRTKQRKASSKRSSMGYESFVRDFNRLVQLKIHKLELDYKGLEKKFEASMQVALNRYPTELQNMSLRELLTKEPSPKKENLPPRTPKLVLKKASMKPNKSSSTKRVTVASDDGYQSESTASQASKATLGPKRRSRSTSSQDKQRKRSRSVSRDRQSRLTATQTMQRPKKDSMMKTPNCKPTNTFVITPKVKLNSAINVLRKPKDGEMVFSTQGSPLLVSTTVNDRTANINVPLRNGNIVSLLPFNESSLTENFHLDDETKLQLKILQSHLSKVLD